MMSVGRKIALFPCVGCLGDRTGGNHVQEVLSLTLDSRGGLMGRQAGVHIGHSHTCVAAALLPPGSHVALVTAAAAGADL